jgi:hypothetical protein
VNYAEAARQRPGSQVIDPVAEKHNPARGNLAPRQGADRLARKPATTEFDGCLNRHFGATRILALAPGPADWMGIHGDDRCLSLPGNLGTLGRLRTALKIVRFKESSLGAGGKNR